MKYDDEALNKIFNQILNSIMNTHAKELAERETKECVGCNSHVYTTYNICPECGAYRFIEKEKPKDPDKISIEI